tara:strand:+ start:425 stop:607 length:183 start_codon:yes stop_codon:yes gene_type:complete
MIKITQIKSAIGYKPKAKKTMIALGLNKINKSVIMKDIPSVRGMINTVHYLIKVEKYEDN